MIDETHGLLNPGDFRIGRAEYWLLTAAVEYYVPLGALLRPKRISEVLNMRGHGLSERELADVLARLLSSGAIDISCAQGRNVRGVAIHDAFREDAPYKASYGLTRKGGALWEELTRPNWELFISEVRDFELQEAIITCADRRMLGRYIDTYTTGLTLVRSDLEVREIVAWEAVYWKTLPKAFTVRVPAYETTNRYRSVVSLACAYLRQQWCASVAW